ncbi:MAG: hypothetical protein AB7Q37_18000 [Pyrinomonadaceae bacterium]
MGLREFIRYLRKCRYKTPAQGIEPINKNAALLDSGQSPSHFPLVQTKRIKALPLPARSIEEKVRELWQKGITEAPAEASFSLGLAANNSAKLNHSTDR